MSFRIAQHSPAMDPGREELALKAFRDDRRGKGKKKATREAPQANVGQQMIRYSIVQTLLSTTTELSERVSALEYKLDTLRHSEFYRYLSALEHRLDTIERNRS